MTDDPRMRLEPGTPAPYNVGALVVHEGRRRQIADTLQHDGGLWLLLTNNLDAGAWIPAGDVTPDDPARICYAPECGWTYGHAGPCPEGGAS